MIYPSLLKKGDTIGVTACSDGKPDVLDAVRLDHAKVQLDKVGYKVLETKNTRVSFKSRSSSAIERKEQLEELLENDEVKAIIMVSGGDYLLEMLPLLDYNKFVKNPKWLQGYSDPTGLLYTVTVGCDIATVYGCNFSDFGMGEWHHSLENNLKLLQGEGVKQESFDFYMDGFKNKVTGYEGYDSDKEVCWRNACGEDEILIEGRFLGGCLDVLLNLVGTKYDKTTQFIEKYKEDGIVWYLESFSRDSEELFTGLWNLREAGWFQYAKGFVFGRPCFFETHTDTTYEEAILSVLEELHVPIIFDADFGHKPPRMAIINGAKGKVYCKDNLGYIYQKAEE